MNAKTAVRRNDIDWLRVISILTVFFYHSGRFFTEDWHVNNAARSDFMFTIMDIVVNWMMPLIFMVSGAGIVYALKRRGSGKFLMDKVMRLLVPLVFGIFFLSPPMVYLERLTHGETSLNFIQWLPQYFDGLYLFGGNFAWMGVHLYYLLLLFLYCIIFLPLFLWLKSSRGDAVLNKMASAASFPGALYIPALLIALLLIILDPDGIGFRDTGGWNLFPYMLYLIFGVVLFSKDGFQRAIIRQRWVSLGIALLFAPALNAVFGMLYSAPWDFGTTGWLMDCIVKALFAWAAILAILGFAMRHLTFENRFLKYANEATLPFYMLHQPVILIFGYFIVQMPISIAAKYAIIAPVSLVISLVIYEIVRRVNVLRVLFGMKPVKRALPAARNVEPQTVS